MHKAAPSLIGRRISERHSRRRRPYLYPSHWPNHPNTPSYWLFPHHLAYIILFPPRNSPIVFRLSYGLHVFLSLSCILIQIKKMKAVSVERVCAENTVSSGRVSKHKKDVENEEIQMYLSKLKDLVPFMPKNRKLTKLEVIQYVIDYICDLQSALETHPAVGSFDAAAALGQKKSQEAVSPRQPLGVRASPNTILAPSEAPIILQSVTTPEKLMSQQERQLQCHQTSL